MTTFFLAHANHAGNVGADEVIDGGLVHEIIGISQVPQLELARVFGKAGAGIRHGLAARGLHKSLASGPSQGVIAIAQGEQVASAASSRIEEGI